MKKAKSELFSQCYEKVWSELPDGERKLLKIICDGPMKRKDILPLLGSQGSYQVYSNSLKKKHILMDSESSFGVAEIALPYFGEYIRLFCS